MLITKKATIIPNINIRLILITLGALLVNRRFLAKCDWERPPLEPEEVEVVL